MTRRTDWRSPDFAKSFDHYDRADFAQEFMRRNPKYRSQYCAAVRAPRNIRDLRLERLAVRWGLLFRH